MRNHEIGLLDVLIIVAHDVEVERARTPMHGAHTSLTLLDALQCHEELAWRERGFECDHLIEICALGNVAERCGLLDRRFGDDATPRKCRERETRPCKKLVPVAEIGAERDVGEMMHVLTGKEFTGILRACQTL